MANYSFSVKDKRQLDMDTVEDAQRYSIKTGISFSRIIVEALKLYMEKLQCQKTQSN